jgi:hypothetical protein
MGQIGRLQRRAVPVVAGQKQRQRLAQAALGHGVLSPRERQPAHSPQRQRLSRAEPGLPATF